MWFIPVCPEWEESEQTDSERTGLQEEQTDHQVGRIKLIGDKIVKSVPCYSHLDCPPSQGVVAEVGAGYVDIRVEDGQPGIGEIADPSSTQGRHRISSPLLLF